MTEREELADAVERIRARIAEIDKHVAQYPSWAGGSTEQHAQDLKLLLAAYDKAKGEAQ